MKNRCYYKFKTKEEQCSLLYRLIKAIEKFEIGEGFSNDLYSVFETLNRNTTLLNEKEEQIRDFSNFIKLLYTVAPINWFPKTKTKQGKIKHVWDNAIIEEYADVLEYELILSDGKLSYEALNFIDNYYLIDKNDDEIEQANMREIVMSLRGTDDSDSQYMYSYIRNNVIAINGEINLKTKRPVYSIRNEKEYRLFMNEFIKPKYRYKYDILEEKVENLFEKIDGPYTLAYCAYCGSKMYKVKDDYVCVGGSICKNNLSPGEEQVLFMNVEVGKSIYIPKRGVSRYNVIPGIDELYLIRKLEKSYEKYDFIKIESYPGKDAEGDVKIIIGEKVIIIDVKSWKKSSRLNHHIKLNEGQFKNKDFLYVPSHLKDEYEKKLSILNDTMKNLGLKTKAISIGSLEKYLKKEIEKYLENPEVFKIENDLDTEATKESVQMSLI